MQLHRPSLYIAIACLTVVLMAIVRPGPPPQHNHHWTLQTSASAGDDFFTIEQRWAEQLQTDSGGRIHIRLLPAGSVVQYNETLDAVGAGILDGHIGDPSYFSGKDPAFAMLGNLVGAWSAPAQMLDYMQHGGGHELYNQLVNPYGVQFIGAAATGLEALLANRPLRNVEDLRGLKLRAPEGMVQEVFAAAGASPVNLPGSEVYTALEKGVIEAADYTVFATNHVQGMHRFARYPIYPGFHSLPMVEISLNRELWQSLPDDLQQLLHQSVVQLAEDMVAELDQKDQQALAEARRDDSIEIIDWSATERAKFRTIARAQWQDWASRSPMAQAVYDSVSEYLDRHGLLNTTGNP